MNKYLKLIACLAICIIAFIIGMKISTASNISSFQDDIVIPQTSKQLGATSTNFYKFKDQFIFSTNGSEVLDSQVESSFQPIDYLNMSVYSKSEPVFIYGSNNLDDILNTNPLAQCVAHSGCNFEGDAEYDYYAVKSDGKVDMRLIIGQYEQAAV